MKEETYTIHILCTNCDFKSRNETEYEPTTYKSTERNKAKIIKGKTVASWLNENNCPRCDCDTLVKD